jgi:hypothetical protein
MSSEVLIVVYMKMAVCSDMMVCRIYCHRHQCEKRQLRLKRRHISTRIYGITFQKMVTNGNKQKHSLCADITTISFQISTYTILYYFSNLNTVVK